MARSGSTAKTRAEYSRSRDALKENVYFLISEVREQVLRAQQVLRNPPGGTVRGLMSREDYIDNLTNVIQRKCFELATVQADDEGSHMMMLQAVEIVAVNLERIADFCENIVDQAAYVEEKSLLEDRGFDDFFGDILGAIDLVESALFDRSVKVALEICRAEYVLDRRYSKAFHQILEELKLHDHVQSLVTILFIYRYLERMGDSLLNIGESVISASLGEKIKIDRFWALEESLDASEELEGSIEEMSLEPMAETRSGCRISRVRKKSSGDRSRPVIFKEGRVSKLEEEKTNTELWEQYVPGLVPKIYSFEQHGDNGSILFEYLPGKTFENVLLQGDRAELNRAIHDTCKTLREVWTRTRTDQTGRPEFLRQINARLPSVFSIHPKFRRVDTGIGVVESKSFEELVAASMHLDDELVAPFNVFIHGDLNLDNIIIDDGRYGVRFIDLHRSRMMDYVQDVSVFLVSNYRLRVFETPFRRRIREVIRRFLAFAKGFASEVRDETFEARLTLGLARSFVTSTRFVLDESFAKAMFLRARFLLESLGDLKDIRDAEVPEGVFFD